MILWISTAWIPYYVGTCRCPVIGVVAPMERHHRSLFTTCGRQCANISKVDKKSDDLVECFPLHSSTTRPHRLSSSRHAVSPTSLSARSSRPAGGFSHVPVRVCAELARIFMPAPIVNLDSRTRAIRRAASGRGRGRSVRRG